MKRLLGLLGLTSLLVLTACFYLGETVALIIGLSALLLFIVSMLLPFARKEGTYPVAFITAVIIVCMFLGYTHTFVYPLKDYDGKTVNIVAYMEDDYYQNGYYNYVLKVKEMNGEKVNSKLLLLSKTPYISEYHDEFRFESEVSFVENKSMWSRKVFFRSYLFEEDEAEIIKSDKRPLIYYFKDLRNRFSNALYLEMDYEVANFSSAVLLGDKHALEPQTKDLLRFAGLSHIAVVSGLHLSIIAAMCSRLFEKLFKNRVVSGCLSILSIIGFALLCGLAAPVIRAGIMLIIFSIGKMISRRSDSINSIGLAALVLILTNPLCVGDVGMLLSFAATLGIVFWSSKISTPIIKKLSSMRMYKFAIVKKPIKILVETFSISLCASLWTLPVIVLVYDGISTVSIIANMLIVPIMAVVLLAISLCILTHYIGFLSVMCDWLSGFVALFYNYLIFVCEKVTALPYSYVNTNRQYFYIWLGLSLVISGVALLINKKRVTVLTVLLSLIILFTGSMNYHIARDKSVTLHIVDAGKGLSVILESSDGYAVLRAEGSKYKTYKISNKIEQLHNTSDSVYIDVSGENSSVYFDNLTNQFDYDSILRYDYIDDFQIDENIKDKIIYYSDMHYLDLWSKAHVSLIATQNDVVQYVTISDTDILIVSENSDCSAIPSVYTHPDVIITYGVPDRYELLKCKTLYVAGNGYVSEASEEILSLVTDEVIRASDGSIDIDI